LKRLGCTWLFALAGFGVVVVGGAVGLTGGLATPPWIQATMDAHGSFLVQKSLYLVSKRIGIVNE